MPLLHVVGIAVGGYAALHVPSVLDSVQILQVQQYLLGWEGGVAHRPTAWSRLQHALTGGLMIPAQPGFAGLTFVPALLQVQLPVVTVASGLKVVTVALAGVIALRRAALRLPSARLGGAADLRQHRLQPLRSVPPLRNRR